MQAVIRIGGKQLVVTEGQTFYAELQADIEPNTSFAAPEVLAVIDGDTTTIGAPLIDGTTVTLKCLDHGKGTKTKAIRFKRRKMVHKITGHRQPFTWLLVEKIG